MDYSTWTNDDLRRELAKRDLRTAGNKEEMSARLELDDAERELDGYEPEPEGPEPEPESAPELEPEPRQPQRPLPRRPGKPATHQPENQDPAVAYRLLPDGRRAPLA